MLFFLLYNSTIEIEEQSMNNTTSIVQHLLNQIETADNATKNDIENTLVSYGRRIVPELVEMLPVIKGAVRGVVAMTLIRIGEPSIETLRRAAEENENIAWISKYLITEINSIAA